MSSNGRKKGGFNHSLFLFGDGLNIPELKGAAEALGRVGVADEMLGASAEGLNSLGGTEVIEKAPDAIDFEDISSSELEDEEEPEEEEALDEEAEAKAEAMARQLKTKLGGAAAIGRGGNDYDEDYDTDSSSFPATPLSSHVHANGAPKPTATAVTSVHPPVKLERRGMGFDDMEKALFGEDGEEEGSSGRVKGDVKQEEAKMEYEMDEDSNASQLSRDSSSMPPPSTPSSIAAVDAGPVLPPAIAAVLGGTAVVLTPSIKQICSSLYNGMDGPILKFSEIFGPQRHLKRSRLRQAARAKARAAAAAAATASAGTVEEEEDEEDLFNKLSYTFYLPKEEVGDEDEDEEAGETGVVVPGKTADVKEEPTQNLVPMKRTKKQLREDVSFVPIPSPVHEAVQTWPWEDEIIWDDPNSTSRAPSSHALAEPQAQPQERLVVLRASAAELDQRSEAGKSDVVVSFHADAKPNLWGAVSSEHGKTAQSAAAAENSVNEVLQQLEEEPVVEPREWSLFPAINEDLAGGDWLEAVIWDDRRIPAAAVNNPLIFDLNDKEMLFEENVKKPTEDEDQGLVGEEETVGGEKKIERRRGRRPKRKISEIASIIEDEVEEDLDPFNYSLDRIYANASRALAKIRPKNMGKPVVQHSIPALKLSSFKTNFTPDDLRLFHRPRTRMPVSRKIKITPAPIEGSRTNPRFKKLSGTIRRKRELSGKDGRVILTEYLEERPPLLSNVGMGTKILNYYRKKDINDIPADKTREDGDMVLLDQSDECPFLGEVPTGDTVQMMDNNLFRAPIVRHNAPTTDFLLVRSKNKFYIREIPAVYAVGQEQPVTEVPAPNSRSANNFIKARLQTFIYRLFKKRANQQRVRISDICSAFPSHSETSIRKRLKDCSDFQRGGDDSGWWTLKKDFEMPSEEDLRAMLTPETVCAYESMLAGQQRLQDVGIEHTSNAGGLAQAVAQLEAESGPRLKPAAKFVKEEVYLAPWNTTGNFLSVQNGKGQLQLTGFGDPTGTGAGFSYLRVPQKVQAQQKKAQVPKTSVTGTDADLRKLSLENSRLVLLKFGVSEEIIEKLGRWERIDLVREKSSAAAAGGDDPNLTKFARGRRFNFQQQQQIYKDECARIFEKQLAFLSELEVDDISDDDDDEDLQDNIELQDFAGEMERELEALFGEDDSNPEPPELPPPKPARGARPSSLAGGPRALARKKALAQQEAEDEEAERRELQKFMEEAREKKREEALQASTPASARSATPTPTPTPTAAVATPTVGAAKPATPATPATTTATTMEVKLEGRPREPFSPFSEASLDGFPSEGGVPGGSPVQPGGDAGAKKPTRKFIKRTVTKKGPDGLPIKVVEIIRDPKKVEEYMKKSKAAKKNRPKLTAEEEAEKQRVRKEKRRLQEQLRRLKKNREKQRILAERLAEGNRDGTLSQTEGTNNQLVCGACGMVGHMRTNRNCPYYTEDQSAVAVSSGTKGSAGGARRGKKRRKKTHDYDEDEDEDEDLDLDDLEDEDDEVLDDLLLAEEEELAAATAAAAKVPPLPAGLVKVEGTKLRFPKAVLAAVTPTATPIPSIPTSPISVVDTTPPPQPPAAVSTTPIAGTTTEPPASGRRPTKRPKTEPQLPTTAATPTPSIAPPASASTNGTPAVVVVTAAAAADNGAADQKKLILRISKRDLPPGALSRSKRPASELSEPNYMLDPHHKVPRTRRKSGRGAGVELASIFEKAVLRVKSHEYAPPFMRPVTPKEAPDYGKFIKKPIDLGTIHDKVKAFKYLSQNAFLADMKLMAANCHKYCETRFPMLPPLADTLVTICIEALRENETEIQELEALIGAQGAQTETEDTPASSRPRSAAGSASRWTTSSSSASASASASTPYTPKTSSSSLSVSSSAVPSARSSRPSSKGASRSGTPRSSTPSSSMPASPSASFHFSSTPSSPVTSVPRVTSTAGSTKVKIKLPARQLHKED